MEHYPIRKQNRLQDYDYSSDGAYFITICTADRTPCLWKYPLSDMKISTIGLYLDESIRKIPEIYPAIAVEKYCIMPDHVHILFLVQGEEKDRRATISRIVKQLKRVVTKQVGKSIWQKGFYDHVVRDNYDFYRIWEYIEYNPLKYQLKTDREL